jgi:SAM-dependent methyltransferase
LTAWTQGYVDGLDYTYDYYRELTPALINFAALCRGQKFYFDEERIQYCELGCGQGFSTNLLAAANPNIEFYANDFNPAHIAGARRLARDAKLENAHFYEHAFAEFADEPSLPSSFDIIALHGVYSWISAENRTQIVEFINRKLKPGGLVFISYNTLPGWASVMPLRRLLMDRASSRSGPLLPRIEDALQFADDLMRTGVGYFKHNPSLKAHIAQMRPMSRNYLAHEYFNEDWHPLYFSDVVEELSGAKLSFVGSIDLLDQIEDMQLQDEQRHLLAGETDPLKRQTLRSFVHNEQFRRDLFVKGAIPHSVRSNAGGWVDARFVLTRSAEAISQACKRRFSNLPFSPDLYEPLVRALSNGPATVREILGSPNVGGSLTWGQVTDGLTMLVGAGYLQPCLPVSNEELRSSHCRQFNAAVCKLAKDSETLQFLASPVTGGGLRIDRFEQLFLLAIGDGHQQPLQWATFAWSILGPQGHRLLKDGNVLDREEDNIAELTARAESFAETLLPICRHLKIEI